MQQIVSLRVAILVVGFCGIITCQSTLFCESAAPRISVINYDIPSTLYPTSSITHFLMSKFDHIWQTVKPEAIRLRHEGLTPQQTCTRLALAIFNDREKFNTVKGWYKRTFSDWPCEEDLKERRQRQNGMLYQQQAGHRPEIAPAFSLQQHQQNCSQNGRVQQAPSSNTWQRQIGVSHQESRQTPQLHDAAIHTTFQKDFHQYPIALFQHTSAFPHGMHKQGGLQNHPSSTASQISTGECDSPYRQDAPRYLSYGKVSQLPAGGIGTPRQQDYTQHRQHSHPLKPRQADEGGHPARCDSLPEPGRSFDRNFHQRSLSSEKNSDSYKCPLESDSFEDHMNAGCFVGMDHIDGDANLLADGQQSTIESTAAPNQFVLASDGQSFNNQPPHHQSVQGLAAGSFGMSISNDRTFALPSHQYPNGAFTKQHERFHSSAKHYRSSSILPNPTPPPRYPLPPDPPLKFGVIHKGPNQPSWQLIRMDGNNMITVDPNGFPTDDRRKRARGKLGSETRDSITIFREHLEETQAIPPESPTSYTVQTTAAQNPLVNWPVNCSNVSVHSSLRDSGYISNFDSAIVESMRSSLSSFRLTDDPNFNTDYKEADDGFVEVEVQAKWRVRKSYLEKRDSSISP